MGTIRFMQDLQDRQGQIDGYYLKFSESVAADERSLDKAVPNSKTIFRNWVVIPWFVQNAWFDLLKFEEYLMV